MSWVDRPGKGTKLSHKVSSAYVDIPGEVSIDGPSLGMGTRPTTNLLSTVETFKPTIAKGGVLTFQLQWDPGETTHKGLTALMAAGSVEDWQLTFNDGVPTLGQFFGILTGFKPGGMEVQGTLVADCEITLTSVIVFTP